MDRVIQGVVKYFANGYRYIEADKLPHVTLAEVTQNGVLTKLGDSLSPRLELVSEQIFITIGN